MYNLNKYKIRMYDIQKTQGIALCSYSSHSLATYINVIYRDGIMQSACWTQISPKVGSTEYWQ